MKILFISICFTFCSADDPCNTVNECNVDILQRLIALETKVENLTTENIGLTTRVEYMEIENEVLKNENDIMTPF